MLPDPDWLANLYLGCFIFGLILTLASTFFSVGHMGADAPHIGDGPGHIDLHVPHAHMEIGHGPGHIDAGHIDAGHIDAGHRPHVDAHVHAGDTGHTPLVAGSETQPRNPEQPRGLSWANMPTILAGITWFGGVGYLLTRTSGLLWTMVLGLAVGGGLLGGYIVYFFFAKIIWPAQTPPMNPEEYALPGTVARVVSGIGPGGTGEIMYTKGGTRSVAGARSLDGGPVPKGTDVQVVRYERGLAYVIPRDATLSMPGADEGQATTKLPPAPLA
jgi:hypothetical protein